MQYLKVSLCALLANLGHTIQSTASCSFYSSSDLHVCVGGQVLAPFNDDETKHSSGHRANM
jgi:hypothetical protein